MYTVSVFVIAACLLPSIHGSAIPMWEYLSRGEKMSHLFNLFVQQVEKHCATRPEPDCSKLLMVYGLTNLAKMEDESLDGMDPYQRGANELVWDSMMKGSKHSHIDSYTQKPDSIIGNSTPNSIGGSSKNPSDLDITGPGSLGAASNINEETETQSFLLGPMVVRVLPNGMPIPGEKIHYPKDEDLEDFVPSKYHSFFVNQQSTNNKLGYGEKGSELYDRSLKYQSGLNPRFFQNERQAVEMFRPRPPQRSMQH